MDVVPALIADGQAPELTQPRQGPLDHPAVASQPLAAVDAFAGDPHLDPAPVQEAAAARDVVRLVGMQLDRALPRTSASALDGRDAIDHLLEYGAVVAIRPGQPTRQRGAPSVRNNMALRARLAAIRRIRAGAASPFLAGMLALSRHARSQSI